MQLRGQVLEQKGHAVLDAFVSDDMVVIQHQRQVACFTACQVIDQHGQHDLRIWGLRSAQQRERRRPNLCIKGL